MSKPKSIHKRPPHDEQLLALALEATSDALWDWDLASGEAFFSPRYYTMLGCQPDEFPANYHSWADRFEPVDR